MSILVTGAAGYIGSHTVKYLQEIGEDVIAVDNLATGHKKSINVEKFYEIDIRGERLRDVFKENKIDAVIHFAANSLVGESMSEPFKYYHNNVYGTMMLLNQMIKYNVKKIVFSSSAATYGEVKEMPIKEDIYPLPTNTYGQTKLAMEQMMKWFDIGNGVKYVSLRYFNAAGAHESGLIGEAHNPETHLIPLILQVPLGKREYISVFGDDYDTKDGTCIRDYIHVMDLARAHYLAYKYLMDGKESRIINLGSGDGYSVNEVIETARKVTGHPIPAVIEKRRAGDPAKLIASNQKAKELLGFELKYDNLEKIISDAWNFHKNHKNGYEA